MKKDMSDVAVKLRDQVVSALQDAGFGEMQVMIAIGDSKRGQIGLACIGSDSFVVSILLSLVERIANRESASQVAFDAIAKAKGESK